MLSSLDNLLKIHVKGYQFGSSFNYRTEISSSFMCVCMSDWCREVLDLTIVLVVDEHKDSFFMDSNNGRISSRGCVTIEHVQKYSNY